VRASPFVPGRRWLLALVAAAAGVALVVVLLGVSSASGIGDPPAPPGAPSGTADQLTPVTATTLSDSSAPVRGTDGRWHVVYELQLANARPDPITLESLEVLDADDESRVVETFSGDDLAHRLRALTSASAESREIGPDVGRLVFIELAFDRRADVPAALVHRFNVLAVPLGGTEPEPQSYTAATFPLDYRVTELGPPLKGGGWVAANGCCATDGIHRATVLPVNGGLHDTQRFAIDWMRMDDQGRLVNGDPSDVHSYVDYGAEIIAAGGGTVVSTLNTLDDQVPGQLPDPSTITLENVDGNHVVVRHRDGRYAFYAHMQKGSVAVEVGDRVRRGQMLGRLGNTGNTSAPHLHFHLMDGPSVLGSSGLPYVLDRFALEGQVDVARWNAATTLEGVWNEGLFASPSPRREQFPLDLNVVDFGGEE
jgi:hypothetical protein